MLNKHEPKTYRTMDDALVAADALNKQRTPDETEFGRYMAVPNHLHGGWLVVPVYY